MLGPILLSRIRESVQGGSGEQGDEDEVPAIRVERVCEAIERGKDGAFE
jgi:hypothetical protein